MEKFPVLKEKNLSVLLSHSEDDDVLRRYDHAIALPLRKRTDDDIATIVAVHEAGPMYAQENELTNYYNGIDEAIDQLQTPFLGGNMNQP